MHPVNPTKNQYRGINAHLHSYWQSQPGWDEFHTNHIADLMRVLNDELLPRQYVARLEQSLQVRRHSELAGRPESDLTIYDRYPLRAAQPAVPFTSRVAPIAIPEAIDLAEELADYRAIAVYRHPLQVQGKPVVWIELLSPSNKPGGQDAGRYRDKRLVMLQSGMVFVELDYLHESASTFYQIARYPSSREPSHPYHIFVVDPRPVFVDGSVYPYHFDVDQSIPEVDIPLSSDDVLSFDFGIAYEKTLTESRFSQIFLTDYTQLLLNFDRYSPDDQARIVNRMIAVVKAAQAGVDLETHAPLPVESLPLDDALAQLKILTEATT